MEISTYEAYILLGLIRQEVKETRVLVSRMDREDPLRRTLTSNLEYLDNLEIKLAALT